jgi:8-oxo-dGTP diphosphatase
MLDDLKYPRVGIGVLMQNEKGQVLLGLRQGSHGAGEWSFPGGHLEFGETIFQAARREAKEETGLAVNELSLISVSDDLDYLKSHGLHYVTIGVKAVYRGGRVKLTEPEKFLEWRWFDLDKLPYAIFEGTKNIIKNFKAGIIY